MAAADCLSDGSAIVGAIVPGDGRIRFCLTPLSNLGNGDWAVVSGPLGDEPARVVFPTGSVDVSPGAHIRQRIRRKMTESELREAEANRGRSLALIDEVSSLFGATVADFELISLRFTLDGTTLICGCVGSPNEYTTRIAQEIERKFNLQAVIQWINDPAKSCGSLARDPHPEAASEATIRNRLGITDASDEFPNGWPRLGSNVRGAAGDGRVKSISVRHNTANLLLRSGETIDVPLQELINWNSQRID